MFSAKVLELVKARHINGSKLSSSMQAVDASIVRKTPPFL
jgi:hypothetical protein